MPILVYLLALAVFAQGTSEFMLSGLLPGIADELGITLGTAGLLTSGFALGMVIGAPTMAVLVRRSPPRWALGGFLLAFIAAHVIGALGSDFGTLLGTRIVAALANAGFLAITMSVIVRIVPAERRASALAVILGGTTVALIAGVPAGALVGEALGWRAALWIVAGLCVPALVGVLAAAPASAVGATGAALRLRMELVVLRRRSLQRYILLAALANGATFCTFTFLAPIVTDSAGMSRASVPGVLALFGAGSLIGVLGAGRFGDRNWRTLIGLGAPLALAGWLGFALTLGYPVAVWLWALPLGAISFCLGSALVTRIVADAEDAPSLGGSFATAALNLGAVVGPAIGGAVIASAGPIGPVLVSAGLALLAVLVWISRPSGFGANRGSRLSDPDSVG